MDTIQLFASSQNLSKLPEIRPGFTVRVHQKIREGEKNRIQIFEGIVIAHKHGKGLGGTITVRKIASGVGVERIFPLHSPNIAKFEIVKTSGVRRAKLYYLRDKAAKEIRKKMKSVQFTAKQTATEPDPQIEPPKIEEVTEAEKETS